MPSLAQLTEQFIKTAKAAGCRGVVVAVSVEVEGHSYFHVRYDGPCLEVEGLTSRVVSEVEHLWDGKKTP